MEEIIARKQDRDGRRITLALTGDVMLGRMVNWVLHYRDAAYP